MIDLQNGTNNFEHKNILKLKNKSLRLLDNHENFPMMVVRIPDIGPSIIYQDFTLFPDEEYDEIETSTILQNLAINSTVSLICGTQYVEGIFDLPTAGAMNYRQLLISFQIPNNTGIYHHEDFVIISVFIPQYIAEYFPSMTYMQNSILILCLLYFSNKNTVAEDVSKNGIRFKTELLRFIKNILQ